jgi:hypothetical protein
MATNIGSLAIQLGLDSQGFITGMNGAINETNDFTSRFQKSLSRSGSIGKGLEKGGRAQIAEFLGGGGGGLGGLVGSAVSPLISPLASAGGTAAAAVDTFKQLGDSLASVVAYSNPATVQQWTMAWDNLYAELGFKVAPLLEGMTSAVHALQDVLRSIIPDFGPVGEMIRGLFDKTKQGFLEANDAFDARSKLGSTQQRKWFEDQSDYVKRITAHPRANLRQRLPFESDESYDEYLRNPEKYGSSIAGSAVAAQKPTFSAIDQVARTSIVNAFQASMAGGGADPSSRTADNTQKIADEAAKQTSFLEDMLNVLIGGPTALHHLRAAGV